VRLFYEVRAVPVNSVLLLPSREQAAGLPSGVIRLGFCNNCGFIYNTAFEPRLVEYSDGCEESQGYSPYFKAWHEALAQRLIESYSLRHKRVLEIGCGKGEFLALLCHLGDNDGIGFDPAFKPGRFAVEIAERVKFIKDFYNKQNSDLNADFICCKMTLEHIADCGDFIQLVRSSLVNSPETPVFFQVPDVVNVLRKRAFWDVYYEHCSYFTIGTLARLFRRVGFEVLDLRREYGEQYITIEARPGYGANTVLPSEFDLEDLRTLVTEFAERIPVYIEEWKRRLVEYRGRGLKTVVWGGGSKGVAFLSSMNLPGAVAHVVDINPHMHGHFTAGTAVPIIGPSALRDHPPDVVIIMNPVYQEEIRAELAGLGLRPELLTA
jgi:SAM-dependent methyltransferase